MECIVCFGPAVSHVTVTNLDGSTTKYVTCDEHEPRFIPGGLVVTIKVQPITPGEPGE